MPWALPLFVGGFIVGLDRCRVVGAGLLRSAPSKMPDFTESKFDIMLESVDYFKVQRAKLESATPS
jgi:hypothetical protein